MSDIVEETGWWTPDDSEWDAPGCLPHCECELCRWADAEEARLAATPPVVPPPVMPPTGVVYCDRCTFATQECYAVHTIIDDGHGRREERWHCLGCVAGLEQEVVDAGRQARRSA